MITIKNQQRKIKLDTKALARDAQTILQALEYGDFDIGIILVSTKKMHDFNKIYRQKDKPTDVLSFPFYPELEPGNRIEAGHEEEKNLGDILLCPEYVMNDLARWNQDFNTRMKVLLVHGICHLLGYDHIEDDDYKKMHAVEVTLLKKIA